jgi:hypothetical protein
MSTAVNQQVWANKRQHITRKCQTKPDHVDEIFATRVLSTRETSCQTSNKSVVKHEKWLTGRLSSGQCNKYCAVDTDVLLQQYKWRDLCKSKRKLRVRNNNKHSGLFCCCEYSGTVTIVTRNKESSKDTSVSRRN